MQPISRANVQPGGAATRGLGIKAPVGVGSSFSHIIIHKLTYAAECNPTTVTDSIQCERTIRAGSGRFRRIPTWPNWRSTIGVSIICRITFRTGERNIYSLRSPILRQCFISDAVILAMDLILYIRREAASGIQPKTSMIVGRWLDSRRLGSHA